MSEMEEKLGAILSNPQMMQQIMSMAQAMSSVQPQKEAPPPTSQEPPQLSLPELDPNLLRKVAGMASNSSVDQNQKALLNALLPYLSRDRVNKLERAMRAAKMASLASSFLNSGGLQLLTGR